MSEGRDVQKEILEVPRSVFGVFNFIARVKLHDELVQSLFLLPAVFSGFFNIKQNFHFEISLILGKVLFDL